MRFFILTIAICLIITAVVGAMYYFMKREPVCGATIEFADAHAEIWVDEKFIALAPHLLTMQELQTCLGDAYFCGEPEWSGEVLPAGLKLNSICRKDGSHPLVWLTSIGSSAKRISLPHGEAIQVRGRVLQDTKNENSIIVYLAPVQRTD